MPRIVDHEQRRQELTEALWRVAERDGLRAVSYREVAAEAGVSVKRVQYYFATKAELLAEALQRIGQKIVDRGIERMTAAGPDPAPRALLRAAVAGSLPTDAQSRMYSHLFFSFYIAAMTDQSLSSSEALQSPRWTVPFAAQLIRRAQELRQAPAHLDADREALFFMTAVSGLNLAILAGMCSPEEALETVDYQLDRILPGQA